MEPPLPEPTPTYLPAYGTSRYIIGSLYIVLAIIDLILLIPLFKQKKKAWQKLFYLLVLFGALSIVLF